MSPKYIIVWKEERIEGKPAYDGGKTPKWGHAHRFNIGTDLSTAGVISFTFFDDSTLICEASTAVSDLAHKSTQGDIWVPCNFEGNHIGKIKLIVQYVGDQETQQPEVM